MARCNSANKSIGPMEFDEMLFCVGGLCKCVVSERFGGGGGGILRFGVLKFGDSGVPAADVKSTILFEQGVIIADGVKIEVGFGGNISLMKLRD